MNKIESTVENWEAGLLGCDDEFAKRNDDISAQVDDALGLQMISIRLDKSLIEELKMIASVHGMGYQPLIRDMLKRFARSEIKRMARAYAEAKKSDSNKIDEPPPSAECA